MASGWRNIRLTDVLQSVSRPEPTDPERVYPLLGAHWYAKGLYTKEVKRGSEIQASTVYRVREGDFVYNRLFAWMGSFALASHDNDNCFTSNEFRCFQVDQSQLQPEFLYYYFARQTAWNEALGLSSGSTPTSRNRLKDEGFLAMSIPAPPLDEQRRIVANIEHLVGKIRSAQSLCEATQQNASALLASERARMFESAARDGSVRLDTIAVLERGKFSYRPRNDPRFFGGNHPWIQIREVESSGKYIREWRDTLNDHGLAVSKKFPKGTVLVSIAATIGAVGILEFDCCVPDSIVGIRPKPGTDTEYLYHYLSYVRSHLEQVAPQSAQKNINLEILSALPVAAPLTERQRRVVDHLNALETDISALDKIRIERDAHLDGLIPSLLDRAFVAAPAS
ncbi:MAG: restriction endonuclease subunit S [Candidatus Dormibacteraeota bacterium]|nr:restriction endonuclease subunit S [Candidatus Dormibacteraeota bacterium]